MNTITIIIPMYNTEKYIEETLYSVIKQKFRDIQIVIIDDGSTDYSVKTVEILQIEYPYIELYSQENQGPSIARNLGLTKANGKYIMFLDSDDLLPKGTLENLYNAIENNGSDVAIGLMRSFSEERPSGWYHRFAQPLANLEFYNKSLDDYPKLIMSLSTCNKIFKKSFLEKNSIVFKKYIDLREDAYFMAEVFTLSEKISHIPFDVYLYRIRSSEDESLTHIINPKVFEDIIYVSNLIDNILLKRKFLHIKEINKYRYTTELIAINFRFETFIEVESSSTQEVLKLISIYLQKIDNTIISIFSFKNRILLFLLKNKHFNMVEGIGLTDYSYQSMKSILGDDQAALEIILREQSNEIKILKNSKRNFNSSIKSQFKHLLKTIKKKTIKKIKAAIRKIYYDTLSVYISLKNEKSDIWLIGERVGNSAQDTGYHFFKFCRTVYPVKNIYFVTKNRNITPELLALGNVIKYDSLEHHICLLSSSVHIFNDSYKDLCKRWDKIKTTKNVEITCFLQHGVIAMSKIQNYYDYTKMQSRFNAVDIFITSSKFEQNIIIKELGHPSSNVHVTGLSRFDNLYRNRKNRSKKIVYIPTWRNWLKDISEKDFLKSKYFKESLSVIKVLTILQKEYDFEIEVCFHHALDMYTHLYSLDDGIEHVDMSKINVQDLIINAGLLITDYSSISFDFAFIQKPVIFYQFDTQEFLDARGGAFIDYDSELFGDVVNNALHLENKLISYINNDFMMFEEDKTKATRYFDFYDSGNSQRIYDVIEKSLKDKRDSNN